MAVNKVNGKVYIGKTIKTLEHRKKEHLLLSKNKSETYFHRAIRKYGKYSFLWEIIFSHYDNNILIEKEMYYISYYDTFKKGYNMTIGGEGISGHKFTEESKKKMSDSSKMFYKNNPERLKLMSKRSIKQFVNNPQLRIDQSLRSIKSLTKKWKDPDYRRKQSERMLSGLNHSSVKIVQVETGYIFDCIIDASKKYNVQESSVRETLNHPNRKSCGFHWVRLEQWNDRIFMDHFRIEMIKIKPTNCAKKVRCIETGEVFNSCTIAGKKYSRNRNAIVRACKSNIAMSAGLHWEFA